MSEVKQTPPAPRVKRTSPSNPKLAEAGWDRLEPTELIERAGEHVRQKVRESTENLRKACAPKHPA